MGIRQIPVSINIFELTFNKTRKFGHERKLQLYLNVAQNRNFRKFSKKSNVWVNIKIYVKNRNFRNFGQKSKFMSKIEMYVKNRNLC